MKFLFVGTHICQRTGYSKVSYQLIKHLSSLPIDLYHFAFQKSNDIVREYPANVHVYDVAAHSNANSMGTDLLEEYAASINPDVVMIYNDAVEISKFLDKAGKKKLPRAKIWVYLDQLWDNIHPDMMKKLNAESDRLYFFVPSWMKKYRNLSLDMPGNIPDMKVLLHGIDDAKTLSPLNVRQTLNINQNDIVFLNLNRNSDRKRLDLTLSGFVKMLSISDLSVYLVMLTNLSGFYDIGRIYFWLLQKYNLDESKYSSRLKIVDSHSITIDDATINQFYTQCDIGVNTSEGEGFGLTVIEHLSYGKPQVITDLDCYKDFIANDDAVEFVPRKDERFFACNNVHGLYAPVYTSDDVAKSMMACAKNIEQKSLAAKSLVFKTWAQVTTSFLEDVLEVHA